MLTIREFHGKDEEDNKIEEKIRNDIKQMLTESNTISDEADTAADEIYRAIRYQKFDKSKVTKKRNSNRSEWKGNKSKQISIFDKHNI